MGVASFILSILCLVGMAFLDTAKPLIIILGLLSYIFGIVSIWRGKVRGLGLTGLIIIGLVSLALIFGNNTENSKISNNVNTVNAEVGIESENTETNQNTNNIQLNQTITEKDWEFSVSDVFFEQRVNPPTTPNYYTYYQVKDTNNTYLCVVLNTKNIANVALSADNVATVKVKYNNNYEYKTFSVSPSKTLGFTYSNITSIQPLTSDSVYYLAELPNSISTETDTPITIEITVNGTTYYYNYR